MCEKCEGRSDRHPDHNRRNVLKAGMSLAAVPFAAGLVREAAAQQTDNPVGAGPYPARAFGVRQAKGPVTSLQIERRALGASDILLDVLYCGICHSDIHIARSDWAPSTYPCVPGHEIVGRVVAVGSNVTKFRIGDVAGVGCMVDSCGTCENCVADREQNCLNGATFTYDSDDKVSGGHTYGGYSDRLVVTERFAIRIPPGVNLAATAPLLCAGVTTFSPMQHWRLARGQRVGVVGLGGLGHIAVKLAVARQANVTVFTTSAGKIDDARRLGAGEAVLWDDKEAMARHANSFDLMITTVPVSYDMKPFVNLLRLDATLVNVGALGDLQGLNGMTQGFGRKSLAGSMIGGIAETQQVIDYCAARSITADIELITPDQINRAWERVVAKDIRYRFVVDFSQSRRT